jgi:hypothetical protein
LEKQHPFICNCFDILSKKKDKYVNFFVYVCPPKFIKFSSYISLLIITYNNGKQNFKKYIRQSFNILKMKSWHGGLTLQKNEILMVHY